MPTRTRLIAALAPAALAAAPLAPPLRAQERPATSLALPPARKTVVAVNPLGALLGIFSAEVEHAVSPTLGVSVGATHWSLLSEQLFAYTSADARLRYYVSGTAPTGLSLGAVGGVTRVESRAAGQSVNALGAGVELNWAELAGRDHRLYLGVGAGAKRLFPLRKDIEGYRFAYPTGRVAVGWAF
ncbi:MAG: hypothetical protein ACJ79S_13115 [Gemmatimonadaceae bacterium]